MLTKLKLYLTTHKKQRNGNTEFYTSRTILSKRRYKLLNWMGTNEKVFFGTFITNCHFYGNTVTNSINDEEF